MGRGPRARTTRAERRMLKERAASALKHGLPVAVPPARRAPVDSWSASPSRDELGAASGAAKEDRRMPIAIKALMLGLVILGSVYGMTWFRDHQPPKAPLQSEAAILPPPPAAAPVASSTLK